MKNISSSNASPSAELACNAIREPDPFLDAIMALMPALRRFGCSLCRDPARADDLVQDTVIKAHINREQFRASTNLKSWLFKILLNCYYSELRRRRFEIQDADHTIADSITMDVDHTVAIQINEVDEALRRLPLAQRDALLLVHVGGLEYSEAAVRCGVALGTIKSRVARARASLQTWLQPRSPAEINARAAAAPRSDQPLIVRTPSTLAQSGADSAFGAQ